MVAAIALIAALLLMLAEQRRSRRNEVTLRRAGAVEPPDDVYRAMAWVYPASFVAMAVESVAFGHSADLQISELRSSFSIGLAIFVAAKLLKYWAIASLGPRWTFRVLVPPGAPLVSSGPYTWLRHPNYVGVVGELVGFAVALSAPATGVISVVLFGWLLRRRIAVEERALFRL
jgi:methyltransferase